MSETGYYKCPCKHCGENIEFPAEAAGSEVPCPHCGVETTLVIPKAIKVAPAKTRVASAAAPVTTPDPVKSAWDDDAIKEKKGRCQSCGVKIALDEKVCPNCGAPVKRSVVRLVFRIVGTVVILALAVVAVIAHLPSKKGKGTAGGGPSGPDLTVLPHTIQKDPNGALTYVVGNVANNSDNRYLAVKVEFELQNSAGAALGTTTDYLPILEPHKSWPFKAMVIDPDAVSAKLLSMTAARYVEDPKAAEERKAAEQKKADDDKKKKDAKKDVKKDKK